MHCGGLLGLDSLVVACMVVACLLVAWLVEARSRDNTLCTFPHLLLIAVVQQAAQPIHLVLPTIPTHM